MRKVPRGKKRGKREGCESTSFVGEGRSRKRKRLIGVTVTDVSVVAQVSTVFRGFHSSGGTPFRGNFLLHRGLTLPYSLIEIPSFYRESSLFSVFVSFSLPQSPLYHRHRWTRPSVSEPWSAGVWRVPLPRSPVFPELRWTAGLVRWVRGPRLRL